MRCTTKSFVINVKFVIRDNKTPRKVYFSQIRENKTPWNAKFAIRENKTPRKLIPAKINPFKVVRKWHGSISRKKSQVFYISNFIGFWRFLENAWLVLAVNSYGYSSQHHQQLFHWSQGQEISSLPILRPFFDLTAVNMR